MVIFSRIKYHMDYCPDMRIARKYRQADLPTDQDMKRNLFPVV